MKTIHTIPALALAASLAAPTTNAQEAQPERRDDGTPAHPHLNNPRTRSLDLLDPEVRRLFQEMRSEMMLPERPGAHDHGDTPRPLRDGIRPMDNPRWLIGLNVEPIEPFIRSHLGIEGNTGVRVSFVMAGSAAAKAGIQVDDILVSANGRPLPSLEALKEEVEKAGQNNTPLDLEVFHKGERKKFSITPTDTRPPSPDAAPGDNARERRFAQMSRRLDRQQREIEELRREIVELRKKLDGDGDE